MEDEDAKVRRNFIAISVVIVLAWWLRVPLDRAGEKLLGMGLLGPDIEWRVWAAAGAALAYFALRFRFSDEHAQAIKVIANERSGVLQRLLGRWLRWETAAFVRWGITPPIFGDGFAALVRARPTRPDQERLPITAIRVGGVILVKMVNGRMQPLAKGSIEGMANLTIERVHGNGSDTSVLTGVGFELGRLHRAIANFLACIWLLLYSKSGTWLVLPWIAGAMAAVVCGVKLNRSW